MQINNKRGEARALMETRPRAVVVVSILAPTEMFLCVRDDEDTVFKAKTLEYVPLL